MTEELIASPALLPLDRAGDQIRLLRLSEADYRQASFLDHRLLDHAAVELWPETQLVEAASRLQLRLNFIFHLGHVGSTLLSRLLGASDRMFSVREPAWLRDVALSPPGPDRDRALDVSLRLLSRTWRPQQRALVKTTSWVSELSEAMMRNAPGSQAIILSTTPPNYIRTVLGGPNSRGEVAVLAEQRQHRLERCLGADFMVAGEGECIAMTWLCEALRLHQTMGVFGRRILWMDFDHLLAAPAQDLTAALRHLGVETAAQWLEALLGGDVMQRYAKAPEHGYSAALRREVMSEAQQREPHAFHSGMRWLQVMAQRHEMVEHTLRRSAAAWSIGPLTGRG